MQAIVTKYHGPTDRRGSRVSATAESGKVTLHWDDELNSAENHTAAVIALCKRFGWKGRIVGGHLPQKNPGHMVYVFDHYMNEIAVLS